MRTVDFRDIAAPGFRGGILRYEIASQDGYFFFRRAGHETWTGEFDSYDAAMDALSAVERVS